MSGTSRPPPAPSDEEITFRASIKRFSTLAQPMSSANHKIRGMNWRISVMPKTYTNQEKESKKCLGFFVQCSAENTYSENWTCRADAEMKLVSQKAGVPNFIRKANNHIYTAKETDWGYNCFMAWDDILDVKRGYIKEDEAVVEVTIRPDFPKNTMNRVQFVAAIDQWYNLAEFQSGKGMTDLAIEANSQGLKFCKNKDEVMKKKLEDQKQNLLNRKLVDSIARIETSDGPTKVLKPRYLRQPPSQKNVPKVAAPKPPPKRTSKASPKEEPKSSTPSSKVTSEETPSTCVKTPVHPVNCTCSEEDLDVCSDEESSVPADPNSYSDSDESSTTFNIGDIDLEEEMAILDLVVDADLEAPELINCHCRNDNNAAVTALNSDESYSWCKKKNCANQTNEDSTLSCQDIEMIPDAQEAIVCACRGIAANFAQLVSHLRSIFDDKTNALPPVAPNPVPKILTTELPDSSFETRIKKNFCHILYMEQELRKNESWLQAFLDAATTEGHHVHKIIDELTHGRKLEKMCELLDSELLTLRHKREEGQKERNNMLEKVAYLKSKVRSKRDDATAVNRELKEAKKDLIRDGKKISQEEEKGVLMTQEIVDLKKQLKDIQREIHEEKKGLAAEMSKAKREAKKDATRIAKIKADNVEKQCSRLRERQNMEESLKKCYSSTLKQNEGLKKVRSEFEEMAERARSSEVNLVRLKSSVELEKLEDFLRKAQVGMDHAFENKKLARTEMDRTTFARNHVEWCHAMDEAKRLLQLTKCDYDIAESLIQSGAKTFSEIEFPVRSQPALPPMLQVPRVQEVKPLRVEIPPPEIKTPAAGVIGESRTPRTTPGRSPNVSPASTTLSSRDEPQSQQQSAWSWLSPSQIPSSFSPNDGTQQTAWMDMSQEQTLTVNSLWSTPSRVVSGRNQQG